MTTRVYSRPGDVFALFLGIPITPAPSPFGTVGIDLGTAIALAFGATQPESGVTEISFSVPNVPALAAATVGFQAATVYQNPFSIELSATAALTIR